MRKLTWKGLEALPDKLGFRTYYRDGVELTKDEVSKLTFEDICRLTTPQTPDEWKEYYQDQQAERQLEEMMLGEWDEN